MFDSMLQARGWPGFRTEIDTLDGTSPLGEESNTTRLPPK